MMVEPPPTSQPSTAPVPVQPIQNIIRQLMKERGWTQQDLAEKADLYPSVISRGLRKIRKLKEPHLAKIAGAFGMPPAELVAGTNAAHLFDPIDEDHRSTLLKQIEMLEGEAALARQQTAKVEESLMVALGEVEALKQALQASQEEVAQLSEDAQRCPVLESDVERLQGQLAASQSAYQAEKSARVQVAKENARLGKALAATKVLAETRLLKLDLLESRLDAKAQTESRLQSKVAQLQKDVTLYKGLALAGGFVGGILGAVAGSSSNDEYED